MSGWVAGAIVVGAGIGAYSAKESAEEQAEATQGAARIGAESTGEAIDLQRQMYEEDVARQEPWREAGVNALARMQGMTEQGFTMGDFQADPGYQFRMEEGVKALDRSASSKGMLLSGAQLKGLTRYGQGMGAQEYGAAYGRWGDAYNRLAGLAGVGQTATGAMQQAGQQFGQQAGAYGVQGGVNQANALLAGGQARASAYQGYGQAAGRAAGQFTDYYQNKPPGGVSPGYQDSGLGYYGSPDYQFPTSYASSPYSAGQGLDYYSSPDYQFPTSY